jgi:hypothetical protein
MRQKRHNIYNSYASYFWHEKALPLLIIRGVFAAIGSVIYLFS